MQREREWPPEQREHQAAKKSAQFFNKRFSSQKIKKIQIVNLQFPCAIMTPWLLCCSLTLIFDYLLSQWMVLRPQMWNWTKISREHRPHHRSSPLQQMELNQCGNSGRFDWTLLASVLQSRLPITKPTSCTLDSNFQSWRTGEIQRNTQGWRIHPLIIVIGESKVTQMGLHCPPHCLEKRKYVSTSHM